MNNINKKNNLLLSFGKMIFFTIFLTLIASCGYVSVKEDKKSKDQSNTESPSDPTPPPSDPTPPPSDPTPPPSDPTPPPAVTATLNFSLSTGDRVDLNWTPSDPGATVTYTVFRSTSSQSGYSAISNCENLSTTNCLDNTVTSGLTYYYKVGVHNSSSTELSNEVSATPIGAFSLTSLTVNAETATIIWPNNVPGITSYTLRYGSSSGNYTTTIANSLSPSIIPNLSLASTQYFQVIATNSSGSITSTNELSAKVLGDFQITSATPGDTSVTLEWSNSSGATSYQLSYGTTPGNYGTTVSSNATSPFTVTGLTNGTTYYFRLQAHDLPNSSRNSNNELSATPIKIPETPVLSLDTSNDSHWDLSWSAVNGTAPITYTVSRTLTYGSNYINLPICINLASTSCSDTTVAVGSTYCYKVTASNSGGSTDSDQVCPPLSTYPSVTYSNNNSYTIPSKGGAPPLTYSIDSGVGSIDSNTGVFSSNQIGSSVVKITDAKNNSQTIQISNKQIRVNGTVNALLTVGQDLFIGGTFSSVNASVAPQMAVLDFNGDMKHDCDLQLGFNGIVYAIAKTETAIYVGGEFTQYQGQSANYIAKLNLPYCTLDTTFSPPANNGFDMLVRALVISGTSLYVGGNFTAYQGVAASAVRVAKLNLSNGAIDTTFSPPASNGFNSGVYALAATDTSLYVGGAFTAYRGVANSSKYIAKLDLSDGTLDTTFSPPANNGFGSAVYALATTGTSLYVGGLFTAYRGVASSANRVAKLDLNDGTLDTTFSPPASNGFNNIVYALAASSTSLYVGGFFRDYRGVAFSANGIAKLNLSDGSLDTTFSPPANNGFTYGPLIATVYSIAISDTSLYVGGDIYDYQGAANSTKRIAKLNLTDGSLDTTFSPPANNGFNGAVRALLVSNNRLYIGGSFSSYNKGASVANNLAKINLTTGNIDTTFSPPENNGFNTSVYALATSGTSLYVGGLFSSYRGIASSASGIAKLDLIDGDLDTTFSPPANNGFNTSSMVYALAVSDTSLYVGGSFTSYREVSGSANRIAKLDLINGDLDTTFSPPANNGFNVGGTVRALLIYNNSLYVGGQFTAYQGVAGSANRIAKLNLTDGSLDTTFSPPANNGFINSQVLALAASGTSLYVGGGFFGYRGSSASKIAKLDIDDGTLDTTFSPPASNGFDIDVSALVISGTSLYVGGGFTTYRGVSGSANRIAKLNLVDGSLDTTFSPPSNNGFSYINGVTAYVYAFSIVDSQLFVGGNIAFYRNTETANFLLPIDLTSGNITSGLVSP